MTGLFLAGPFASAAAPVINAMESTVNLGLTSGYGGFEEDIQPRIRGGGPLLGVSAGVSELMPTGPGWPDLYTSVAYNVTGSFFHDESTEGGASPLAHTAAQNGVYNTAIVRLGLGSPLSGSSELIPYIAGGYQNWHRGSGGAPGYKEFYQSGIVGLGVRLDVAANQLWVVTAAAEGLAVLGGSVSAASPDFSGTLGPSAEERVSLDADYRLNGAWHAFAGLGLTHYGYAGTKLSPAGTEDPLSNSLQVNSTFGVAYGF